METFSLSKTPNIRNGSQKFETLNNIIFLKINFLPPNKAIIIKTIEVIEIEILKTKLDNQLCCHEFQIASGKINIAVIIANIITIGFNLSTK